MELKILLLYLFVISGVFNNVTNSTGSNYSDYLQGLVSDNSCERSCISGSGCRTLINDSYFCYCDDLCYYFSDCCHNSQFNKRNISEFDKFALNHVKCFLDENCFMVAKCPDNWTDNRIRTRCEHPSNNTYKEILPVYVLKGHIFSLNIHFRNKYCALCHGQQYFSPWQGILNIESCDFFKLRNYSFHMNMNDVYEALRIKEGCVIIFQDPSYSCRACTNDTYSYPDPSLSILLNFLNEPMQADQICTTNNKTEIAVNVNQFEECNPNEIIVNGLCKKIYEQKHYINITRYVHQAPVILTLDEAEIFAREYLTFVCYRLSGIFSYDVINRWAVTVLPGRIKGSDIPCTEIQLDVLMGYFYLSDTVTLAMDSFRTPCFHLPCPVTFLPFSHPQRSRFCDTSTSYCSEESLQPDYDGLSLKSYLTFISLSVSVTLLSLSLIVFFKCPLFHNLPGKNHASLMSMVLLAHTAFLVSAGLEAGSLECKVLSVALHYFWLSAFCWMSVCSFHAWFTFSTRGVYLQKNSNDEDTYYRRYCILGFFFPVAIVVICLAVDFMCESCGVKYGEKVCFISDQFSVALGFAIPVGMSTLLNYVFFALTVRNIQRIDRLKDNYFTPHRCNFIIYVKLSSLMGLYWIFGFLAEIIKMDWIHCLAISINGLQGAFIFVSFICTRRVLKWFRGGKSSTSSLPRMKESEINESATVSKPKVRRF